MMNVSLLNPLYVSGATIKHLDCVIVNKNGYYIPLFSKWSLLN